MQSLLGKVTVEEGAEAWPLSSLMADRFGRDRIARVVRQLMLSTHRRTGVSIYRYRDVMALVDLLKDDPLSPVPANLGDRFNRHRRPDVMTRTLASIC